VKHDTRYKMHYEYTFTVETRPTRNDFIDLFATLVAAHGKRTAAFYAHIIGTDEWLLKATLKTLSGAGIREWTDALAAAVAETLLRETSLPVGEIAAAAGWGAAKGGRGIFTRWFTRRYKCSPLDWRWR
jgi:AraC-like DNA-binding protein